MIRVAIISDIHGNRTAFEAALADLRQTSPDLILHGGDLADSGSDPAGVLDQIRDLGWPGVLGNTDEMLFRPESLKNFAAGLPQFSDLFNAVEEMAAAARETLGAARLDWLSSLPLIRKYEGIALVHASPDNCWRTADDTRFADLGAPIVAHGHTHRPLIRTLPGFALANAGSVGLPHDGDRRASYLLITDGVPEIRRVAYDVEAEIRALMARNPPHAHWIAATLRAAAPQPLI